MTKQEAIEKAKVLAHTTLTGMSIKEREAICKELNRLFKEYDLTWNDVN